MSHFYPHLIHSWVYFFNTSVALPFFGLGHGLQILQRQAQVADGHFHGAGGKDGPGGSCLLFAEWMGFQRKSMNIISSYHVFVVDMNTPNSEIMCCRVAQQYRILSQQDVNIRCSSRGLNGAVAQSRSHMNHPPGVAGLTAEWPTSTVVVTTWGSIIIQFTIVVNIYWTTKF